MEMSSDSSSVVGDPRFSYQTTPAVKEIVKKSRKKEGLNVMDGEVLHEWWVKEEIRLSQLEGNYKVKDAVFIKNRLKNSAFRAIALPKEVGKDGRIDDVCREAVEYSWRGSSKPDGPAEMRRRQRVIQAEADEWAKKMASLPTLDELDDNEKELWYTMK